MGKMVDAVSSAVAAVKLAQASTVTNIEYDDLTDPAVTQILEQVPAGMRSGLKQSGTTFCAREGYEQPFWLVNGKCYIFEDRLQESAFWKIAITGAAMSQIYDIEGASTDWTTLRNERSTLATAIGTSNTYTNLSLSLEAKYNTSTKQQGASFSSIASGLAKANIPSITYVKPTDTGNTIIDSLGTGNIKGEVNLKHTVSTDKVQVYVDGTLSFTTFTNKFAIYTGVGNHTIQFKLVDTNNVHYGDTGTYPQYTNYSSNFTKTSSVSVTG